MAVRPLPTDDRKAVHDARAGREDVPENDEQLIEDGAQNVEQQYNRVRDHVEVLLVHGRAGRVRLQADRGHRARNDGGRTAAGSGGNRGGGGSAD